MPFSAFSADYMGNLTFTYGKDLSTNFQLLNQYQITIRNYYLQKNNKHKLGRGYRGLCEWYAFVWIAG